MNKAELVAKVADKTGFKKKDAELALDAVLETIEKALVDGDSVRLIGFGTFETRSEETLRNRMQLSRSRLPRLLSSRLESPSRTLLTNNTNRLLNRGQLQSCPLFYHKRHSSAYLF